MRICFCSSVVVCLIAFIASGCRLAKDQEDDAPPYKQGMDIRLTLPLGSGPVYHIATTPDSRSLVVSSDKGMQLLDLGSLTWKERTSYPVQAIRFSADGKSLCVNTTENDPKYTIELRDGDSGRLLHTLTGHQSYIHGFAFSPDGKTLATGSCDGTVRLWNPDTGACLHMLLMTGFFDAIAFSPDGKIIAGACRWGGHGLSKVDYDVIALWKVETGKLMRTLTVYHYGMEAVAFARDGSWIAGTSWELDDRQQGDLCKVPIWNMESGNLEQTLSAKEIVQKLMLSPDGHLLAAAEEQGWIQAWDTRTWKEVWATQGHKNHTNTLAFTSDGNLMVTGSARFSYEEMGEVCLWDAQNGHERARVTLPDARHAITHLSLSDDGLSIVAVDAVGRECKWNAKTGILDRIAPTAPTKQTDSITSPDSRWSATLQTAGHVSLRQVEEKQAHTLQLQQGQIRSIVFSPDSLRCVTCSVDLSRRFDKNGEVSCWDVQAGTLLWRSTDHTIGVMCAAFSQDGKSVATGGTDERIVIRDAGTGTAQRDFQAHVMGVNALTFSKQGNLISAGEDGLVRIWKTDGRLIATMLVLPKSNGITTDREWLTYTPDNYYVCSPDAEKAITWVLGDCPYPVSAYRKELHHPERVAAALSS